MLIPWRRYIQDAMLLQILIYLPRYKFTYTTITDDYYSAVHAIYNANILMQRSRAVEIMTPPTRWDKQIEKSTPLLSFRNHPFFKTNQITNTYLTMLSDLLTLFNYQRHPLLLDLLNLPRGRRLMTLPMQHVS